MSAVEDLGAELGALLIERVAPEEEDLYPEIIESYRGRVEKGAGKSTTEHPLAIGAGEIVGIMSPLVYEAGKIAVGYMFELAKDTATDTLKEAAKDAVAPRISVWFKSRLSASAPVKLDPSKVDELVNEVREKMGNQGVEPALNEKIADAVRGLLQQATRHDGK
jgi:hypothetical protein